MTPRMQLTGLLHTTGGRVLDIAEPNPAAT
jgi:hypothetical protein